MGNTQNRHLFVVVAIVIVAILTAFIVCSSFYAHHKARQNASTTFHTIESILKKDNGSPFVFTLLPSDTRISLYVIDPNAKKIIGSTDADDIGKAFSYADLSMDTVVNSKIYTKQVKIDGIKSYCIFSVIENYLIGYVVSDSVIYSDVIRNTVVFALILLLIAFLFVRFYYITKERDIDFLTGLLNRRSIHKRLTEMFATPEKMKHGAIIMIDADNLKKVNDTFGHGKGDDYLKKIGSVISSFGKEKNLSARLDGDEFITILYGYNSDEEAQADIDEFMKLQGENNTFLDNDVDYLVGFSAGYILIYGQKDFHALLDKADKMMYENKRMRKEKLELIN